MTGKSKGFHGNAQKEDWVKTLLTPVFFKRIQNLRKTMKSEVNFEYRSETYPRTLNEERKN